MTTGRLVLVGTPLGNRDDLSPRARRAIVEADVLLCEDTRSPRRLLGEDEELPVRVSCFVANEDKRIRDLLHRLAAGQTVVYVSEAGMPVWSDPGQKLVAAAVRAGYEVDVVPGPTAATTALCHSGLPAEGALFLGFIPRDGAARKRALARVAEHDGATVLYEAGNRTARLLCDLQQVCADAGTRPVTVARELTKLHQQLSHGTLAELAAATVEVPPRGEVTVVVGPAAHRDAVDAAQAAARRTLEIMLDANLRPRERAKALAEQTGLDARVLYSLLGSSE
jgi:16S rRNA (cytidine1402-2'-O)-methyltransferase